MDARAGFADHDLQAATLPDVPRNGKLAANLTAGTTT
jgi:hypothetical protein